MGDFHRPISRFATEATTDVAQQLETDIRVGIITKIDPAEIQWPRRHQVRSPMIRIGLHGLGRRRDFLVLAHLPGVFGIRRRGKRTSRY